MTSDAVSVSILKIYKYSASSDAVLLSYMTQQKNQPHVRNTEDNMGAIYNFQLIGLSLGGHSKNESPPADLHKHVSGSHSATGVATVLMFGLSSKVTI